MRQNRFYFLDFPETKQLFGIFNQNNIKARFVGGCVRDALLDIVTSDFDIAVNIPITNLMKILTENQIKYVETGVKYHSIIAILNNKQFDITSLRSDFNCLGRGCDISNIDSFEEDAKRRDFTINAIYIAENGEMFDYFKGFEDLKNRRVVFIGDPQKRIEEDYLRILRYYRFCTKIGDESIEYSDVLKKNAHYLKKLSIERIQKELFQIIHSFDTINIMYKNNIVQQISDCINIKGYNKLNGTDTSTLVKLVVLFGFDAVLNIFKLKKEERRRVSDYKTFIKETLEYCYYKKGIEFTREMMVLRYAFSENQEIFPLTYRDIPAGVKNISQILQKCEKWWVNNNFPSKGKALDFMQSLLKDL